MKDKIIQLFQTGDLNNIYLGFQLAEGQGYNLQTLCHPYTELLKSMNLAGITLFNVINYISNLNNVTLCWYNKIALDNLHLLSNCKNLNLSKLNLKKLPDDLFKLRKLEILNVHENRFSDIPDIIFDIPTLKRIILNPCHLKSEELSKFIDKCNNSSITLINKK